MKYGFVKVAASTPSVRVADVTYNTQEIKKMMTTTYQNGAKVSVFPELAMTGYTCGDLFTQDILLERVKDSIAELIEHSKGLDTLFFVGAPIDLKGKLYNAIVVINDGNLLGIITKTFLPNYGEFYEMRQFSAGPERPVEIEYLGYKVFFGPKIIFQADNMEEFVVSGEICEDVWAPVPPSIDAAVNGAAIIVNCSASTECIGKYNHRTRLINTHSDRLIAGYVYANAGEGESTTDTVFGGHSIIAEQGKTLCQSRTFEEGTIYSEIDVFKIHSNRRKNTTFHFAKEIKLPYVAFHTEITDCELTRKFPKSPYMPEEQDKNHQYCEESIQIQAMGLKKRLEHIHCKSAVVGLSGGLDSTLALIVTAKAFDILSIDRKNIVAITMPCYGTTSRTYNNAKDLADALGVTLKEVSIKEAVALHFSDIGHDVDDHNVTYENAQARERTQVLMSIANELNGIVIGTGDLSELALGWATYNGDHMSMYGVNAGLTKTMVKSVVEYTAFAAKDEKLKAVLMDIVSTPVSPELLPPTDGDISQVTEDLVGPYELHDYFLYYMLQYGFSPTKIFHLVKATFADTYEPAYILKWMRVFYTRFFQQQYKRSCLPDGPKVGEIGLSPRGDLRMPSDACGKLWIDEIDSIEI